MRDWMRINRNKIILMSMIFVILLSGCTGRTYDEGYEDGYQKGYSDGEKEHSEIDFDDEAYEAGYNEGYSEGLYEIPDDIMYYDSYNELIKSCKTLSSDEIGIDHAADLLFYIQDDHPEVYKQIIDAYGIDKLPFVYEYFVLDEDNKVCHIYNCSELKNIDPYTATIKLGVDKLILSNYQLCPVCGNEVRKYCEE